MPLLLSDFSKSMCTLPVIVSPSTKIGIEAAVGERLLTERPSHLWPFGVSRKRWCSVKPPAELDPAVCRDRPLASAYDGNSSVGGPDGLFTSSDIVHERFLYEVVTQSVPVQLKRWNEEARHNNDSYCAGEDVGEQEQRILR